MRYYNINHMNSDKIWQHLEKHAEFYCKRDNDSNYYHARLVGGLVYVNSKTTNFILTIDSFIYLFAQNLPIFPKEI